MSSDDDWFTCPVCGEVVPINALACPECGADDETGWSEESAFDDLDLPYGDEEQTTKPLKQNSAWFTFVAALLVLMIVVFTLMRIW